MGDQTATTDVTTSGEETASTSSSTEQTTATTDKTVSDHVPYSRFVEANETAKRVQEEKAQLERELQAIKAQSAPKPSDQEKLVKETLKSLGFASREDVQAELKQREEDARIQSELSSLEKEWDGTDGKPKFVRKDVVEFAIKNGIGDPEAAFLKMNKSNILDYEIRKAASKTQGVKSEVSTGTGGNTGVSNEDLKTAIKAGDKDALKTYLKRLAPKS